MKNPKAKIAYLNVNRFNPVLADGVSRSTLELLQFLKNQGHEVSILSFLTNEPYKQRAFNHLTPISGSANWHQAMVQGVEIYQELLPFTEDLLYKNSRQMMNSISRKVKELQIARAVTTEDDGICLAATSALGIPGIHFIHSPAYIRPFVSAPLLTRLLKSRPVFAVSRFLQKKIKSEIGIKAGLWHPVFDLSPFTVQRNQETRRVFGFYSAGRHKGDEIVNRLIRSHPDWNFLVIGRNHTWPSVKLPANLKRIIEISDPLEFYRSIGILLVPSLGEEGFPRVILEAAASGIPVISNAAGGIQEAVGKGGILIKTKPSPTGGFNIPKISEIYAREMKKLLDDERWYESLSQRAMQRAREYGAEQRELSQKNYRLLFGP